ncbi:MAG: hypothetical protein PUD20_01655 [bacterium]|nr:hypothetical protein [bacterium]
MKLSDFCILFVGLFICTFLGRDLEISRALASRCSEVMYNRQMDRISEDALMDVVEQQYDSEALQIRNYRLEEQYGRLLRLAFDIADEDVRLRAREAVVLKTLEQYPYAMSSEQLQRITEQMEKEINEEKRRRRELAHISLTLPFADGEAMYQSLAGPQLTIVFDPKDITGFMDRVIFSGSRIVKIGGS